MQRHEKRNICKSGSYLKRDHTPTSSQGGPTSSISNSYPQSNKRSASSMYPAYQNGVVGGSHGYIMGYEGMWQNDPWDAVFNDAIAGSWAPESVASTSAVGMGWGVGIGASRMQESAERGQSVFVDGAWLQRLKAAYPDMDLSSTFVNNSLCVYWSDVAPVYPFIHRGTFDLFTAPSELIIMMVIIGASASHTITQNFRSVVKRVRGQLVQQCGLDMALSTLQTFSLCHMHDVWYGNAESLFEAQVMWPIMVSHARKKGIGVAGPPDHEARGEEAWAMWAKDEERRRAAFCVLLLDTQASMFWNQHVSRQLSIFAHNLQLPSPRSQWEATTASDWMRSRSPPPASPTLPRDKSGYLPGLHPEFMVNNIPDGYAAAVMSALGRERPLPFMVDAENSLGVEMILCGLMAIAWDCRTRGGMGIRLQDGMKHWRYVVFHALINLRIAWEESTNHLERSPELYKIRDTFAVSVVSVLADIPMLQVAAGAKTVCGAPIGERQFEDARRRLRLWAKTDDAWKCVWQCARYLKMAITGPWGVYSSWGVFLSTLVIWSYAWAARPDAPLAPPHPASDLGVWKLFDDILEAKERLDVIDGGVGDLISCVAERLEGGEEVEREEANLLWRLIQS
ncbi:hypothetical protein M231_04446 [Tremella mesenterica]|uniref:Xylanolytic transcriptional activator regulatory domain-containing protein n=1 Tax=Tremella mesenterica TaxID=5217 RepID=A0A4Q1BKF5_TREME|nr:hypothetical protein M231_04446 [Tremella mesenterica]